MPSRKTPRSNIYRQIDPSVNNNRGSNPDANITLVRAHDDDPTTVTIFFDQPLIATGAPIGPPSWTANGHAFASFGALAPDGDSLDVTFAGNVSAGDAYDFPITVGGIPYTTALSGNINSSSGTVADSETPANTFDLVSIAPDPDSPTDTVLLTFDAPIAVVTSATSSGGQVQRNLSPFTLSSTHLSGIDHVVSDSVISCGVAGAYTSGTSYSIPGGRGFFVSITGAALNAKTGTVDPA